MSFFAYLKSKEEETNCKTLTGSGRRIEGAAASIRRHQRIKPERYCVEYGDKASRDRGNADLAKELEKLKE